DLFAGFGDQLDGQGVVVVRGVDDVLQLDGFRVGPLAGDNAAGASVEPLLEDAGNGLARGFRFQAPFLAAVAEDFIVEYRDVAQFAGKARLAIIKLAIDHDAHADAMVDIDEQDVLFTPHSPVAEFAIGHRPGVVLQERVDADGCLDDFAQRVFVEIEKTVAVAGLVVDAPAEVDPNAEYLLPSHRTAVDEVVDDLA